MRSVNQLSALTPRSAYLFPGAPASHAGSGSEGPGDRPGALAQPSLLPSLWQELRIPCVKLTKVAALTTDPTCAVCYCACTFTTTDQQRAKSLVPTFADFLSDQNQCLCFSVTLLHQLFVPWGSSSSCLCSGRTVSVVSHCCCVTSLLFLFFVWFLSQHNRKPLKPRATLTFCKLLFYDMRIFQCSSQSDANSTMLCVKSDLFVLKKETIRVDMI